jgi:probable F420-dependent oxidoreductase
VGREAVAVKLGVFLPATDRTVRPDEAARHLEARGFASLFLPEHTHIPTSRRSPFPSGGDLPDFYRRMVDPFVGLATAAAATDTLEIGTGVCLVAQHDPIVLAKQVATLDLFSGGRFVFGVGYGWNREEVANHGVDPRTRRAVVRERLLAMSRLWEDDEAEFTGEHVRFERSWMWPKPAQRPRPPIYLGGTPGTTLFRHVVELADGWMPIGGSGLARALDELRRTADEAGRDPETIGVGLFGVVPDPGKLDHYRALGVERVVFSLPPCDRDRALRLIDGWTDLLDGR